MGGAPEGILERVRNGIRRRIEDILNQRRVQEFLGEFGRSEEYVREIRHNLKNFCDILIFIGGTLRVLLDQLNVEEEISYLRQEISRIDDEIKRMRQRMRPYKPSLEKIFLRRLEERSDIEEIERSLKLYEFYELHRDSILKMLGYYYKMLDSSEERKRRKYKENFENVRKEIYDKLESYMKRSSKKEISKDLDLIKRFMEMDSKTEENLRFLVKILNRDENILQAKNALSSEYSNSIKEFRKKIEKYNQKMEEFEEKSRDLLSIREEYERRLREITPPTGISEMLRNLNKNNVMEKICNIFSKKNFTIEPVPWEMSVISYLAEKEKRTVELYRLINSLSLLLPLEYIRHKVKESLGKKRVDVYKRLEDIINDFKEIHIATSIIRIGASNKMELLIILDETNPPLTSKTAFPKGTHPLGMAFGPTMYQDIVIGYNTIEGPFKEVKKLLIGELGKDGKKTFDKILSFISKRSGKLISLKGYLSKDIEEEIGNFIKKVEKKLKKRGIDEAIWFFITELFGKDFLYGEARRLHKNILESKVKGVNKLIIEYFRWKNEDIDFLHNILSKIPPIIYLGYKKSKYKTMLDFLEAIVMYREFLNKYEGEELKDEVRFFLRSNIALSSLHILFLSGIGNSFLETIEELCQEIYSLKRPNTC